MALKCICSLIVRTRLDPAQLAGRNVALLALANFFFFQPFGNGHMRLEVPLAVAATLRCLLPFLNTDSLTLLSPLTSP